METPVYVCFDLKYSFKTFLVLILFFFFISHLDYEMCAVKVSLFKIRRSVEGVVRLQERCCTEKDVV